MIGILISFVAGLLNGNMDALRHYKNEIVWRGLPDSLFKRWLLRGSAARRSIPGWVKRIGPLYSLVKSVWDGWHGTKTTMFFLLIAVYPHFISSLWQALLSVLAFQLAFYLSYHIFLKR